MTSIEPYEAKINISMYDGEVDANKFSWSNLKPYSEDVFCRTQTHQPCPNMVKILFKDHDVSSITWRVF